MKNKLAILSFICLLIGISSCKKEVDFTGVLPNNKIVLNCFVDADSVIAVTVSKSWNLSQKKASLLRDAQVDLYINDAWVETLPQTDPLNKVYTHLSTVKAKTGDLIKITAKSQGLSDVESEVVMPGKALIESIDTATFSAYDKLNYLRANIKFKDVDANKKNFYRLVVSGLVVYSDSTRPSYENIDFYYEKDRALRDGFQATGDESLENSYHIFNDVFFDGREYTLNINFAPMYSFTSQDSTNRLSTTTYYGFDLITLSESAYNYLKTKSLYDYNGSDNFFAEPVPVFTNITNGLGILGAFQRDRSILIMPVHSY